MTNKEKFLALTTQQNSGTIDRIKFRLDNRSWLKRSQVVAIKVLVKLDELSLSQKDLAAKMNVSPQYINRVVKGSENLTLETLDKLEVALGIDLLVKGETKIQQTYSSIKSYNPLFKLSYNPDNKVYNKEKMCA